MRRTPRPLLLLMAACGVMAACGEQNDQIFVSLRTDFVPVAEFAEIRLFLTGPDGAESSERIPAERIDYVAGQRIASFNDLVPGAYRLRGELLAADGRRVGERTLAFSFSGLLTTTILITRSCRDVICPVAGAPDASECSGGRCVRPECSQANPEACESGCIDASGCVAEADCATGVCAPEGACLFDGIPGACEPSEYCSAQGCVPMTTVPRPIDGAPIDAGSNDAGPADAEPPQCGMPCPRTNPCELGIFDCTTGAPVCVAGGAGNVGTVCREAAGPCDVAEECDGLNTECGTDERRSASFECNPADGECDRAELCDGVSNACPTDESAPVGSSCMGGAAFCNASGECSTDCTPGDSCSIPGQPCQSGITDCSGAAPRCVVSMDQPDGTMCASMEFGAWGTCSGFGGTCGEAGMETRAVNRFSCTAGVCGGLGSSESRACTRDTDGVSCDASTTGPWSACAGFSGTCGETGTRSRTLTTPTCASGSCNDTTSQQTEGCLRNTNGVSCGSPTAGPWGTCGGFSETCDEIGTRSRTITTPTCGSGTCGSQMSTENGSCSRSTTGTPCGTVTTGAWSACSFSGICAASGTRTRNVFTPTCSDASCGSVTTTESGACSRGSQAGVVCGAPSTTWGVCTRTGVDVNCDPAGTQAGTTTTPVCGASGSCNSSTMAPTSRACTATVVGDSCHPVCFSTCQAPFDCFVSC